MGADLDVSFLYGMDGLFDLRYAVAAFDVTQRFFMQGLNTQLDPDIVFVLIAFYQIQGIFSDAVWAGGDREPDDVLMNFSALYLFLKAWIPIRICSVKGVRDSERFRPDPPKGSQKIHPDSLMVPSLLGQLKPASSEIL